MRSFSKGFQLIMGAKPNLIRDDFCRGRFSLLLIFLWRHGRRATVDGDVTCRG